MNKCRIEINGDVRESEDFICVCADEEKGAVMYFNTDALTMGMAVQMITNAFRKAMDELSEEDQKEVFEALGLEVCNG